jgi:hypothetical protein
MLRPYMFYNRSTHALARNFRNALDTGNAEPGA